MSSTGADGTVGRESDPDPVPASDPPAAPGPRPSAGPDPGTVATEGATRRLPGPDVVRAVAMAGVVVMNFHGYLILRGGSRGETWLADVFDPWTGPLSTRFAATFVLTAGVGVALLAASSLDDPERLRTVRWRLASRGLVLYVFGLAFDLIWRGSILPFYGAMFAVGAVVVTWRSRWLVTLAITAAFASWGIRAWRFEREFDGHSTRWLTDPGTSPRGLVLDVFVNGTHPLLPWLAMFSTGIVIGRAMLDPRLASSWRASAAGGGLVLFAVAALGNTLLVDETADARAVLRWSTHPFDRGILYTASALGTALVAFAVVTWLADRFAATRAVGVLGEVGRASLSIYVAHALVFNLVVDWLGWVEPSGVGTALAFAFVVWVTCSVAAVAWQRRHGLGPFELVYRRLTV